MKKNKGNLIDLLFIILKILLIQNRQNSHEYLINLLEDMCSKISKVNDII